jgi:Zinc carboxypeptidase
VPRPALALPLASALLTVAPALRAAPVPLPTPQQLWAAWPSSRVVTMPAPCLRPDGLVQAIRKLEERHPGRLVVEEVGRSVQGRPIHLVTVGQGPRRVLLWSQMHGDEPSATPALLDVAEYLLSGGDPVAQTILRETTLLMVPMLNPDGAGLYVRRNAQAIDINRDALRLSTPEGRLLKSLRERFAPELGFNLHDQNRRTTVDATGRLATIALLAVAGDAAGTMTPGRARAKRVCAAIVRALEPFVPGGIARYDEDFNPRAFGDNLTAWGTPVVLIESGGLPPGRTFEDLTRLNFVALLSALGGLARDDLAGEDPALYEDLRRNADGEWVDALVAGGEIWQPGAGPPYRADLAFDVLDDDPVRASCAVPGGTGPSRVREVGDGHLLTARRRIDADGLLVCPALAASIRGIGARAWLDGDVLDALARLGVARLRWRVEPADRRAAAARARSLETPGRPAMEVADLESDPRFLEIPGPPESPGSLRLDAVLDALTGGAWRKRAGGRSLDELLGPLTGYGENEAPLLRVEEPASLLLLRPQSPGTREMRALVLERVLVDGREPGEGR